MKISIETTLSPKSKPQGDLGFGKYFSDHMFVCDFDREKGWHSPRVVPYAPFIMDPGASALHYGQALFEGMKAFKQVNNQSVLFRPQFNYHRMVKGAERLCMEAPSKEIFIEGIRELVKVDESWIPTQPGSSLYLRPTLIGTEAFLGVRPSDQYKFFVICSPVSSYYKEGMGPVRIWVEDKYVRAVPGGLGDTKAAANYAGSLRAALDAKNRGFAQVLWLDAAHENVEEVGTMNVFFVINGEVHTPALSGSILEGGVRSAVIQLLKDFNIPIHERKISWKELVEAHDKGVLTEAFGTGTAAVISPIRELAHKFKSLDLSETSGPIAKRLYEEITGIQYGKISDRHGWVVPLR